MNWKFWKKQAEGQGSGNVQETRLSRPKEIPEAVGRYLVVDLHEDPDWVWDLKVVERQQEQEKTVYDIRVFDPYKVGAQGIRISDYQSFDTHPELVLFEGWFDKKTRKLGLEKRQGSEKVPEAA